MDELEHLLQWELAALSLISVFAQIVYSSINFITCIMELFDPIDALSYYHGRNIDRSHL